MTNKSKNFAKVQRSFRFNIISIEATAHAHVSFHLVLTGEPRDRVFCVLYYISLVMYRHAYWPKTEWIFVRARTNRFLAIRTECDHMTIVQAHAISSDT